MNKDLVEKLGLLFYICSIIGYLYELILHYIIRGKLFSHGFLNGPWLPIYGVGSIFMTMLNKYKNNPFLIFILSFFIAGILEYITGLLLLKIYKIRLWDYTGRIFSIGGHVCLLSAFCFGIGGLLVIYLLKPLVNKIYNIVNKKLLIKILSLLTMLFMGDIIATTLN